MPVIPSRWGPEVDPRACDSPLIYGTSDTKTLPRIVSKTVRGNAYFAKSFSFAISILASLKR